MKRLVVIVFVVVPLLGLVWAVSAAPSELSIPWWTVDGGGGSASGGGFVLRGTIGQPDAALSSGGGYTLIGGFWNGGLAGSDGNHRVYLPLVLNQQ